MPGSRARKYRLRFLKKLRAIIIAGLVVMVPIGLTIWILVWLFELIDNLLRPLTVYVFGQEVIGVGFGVILLLILIVGMIATNVIGKRVVHWAEAVLAKIPITKSLYVAIKQVFQSFADPQKTGFMQVVMVQYPRKGIYTLGFVTNEYQDESGKKIVNVFVPTSPNPTTGFLQIMDESEVIRTRLTIEEGLKMVVSAGRIAPPEVVDKLVNAKSLSDIETKNNQ